MLPASADPSRNQVNWMRYLVPTLDTTWLNSGLTTSTLLCAKLAGIQHYRITKAAASRNANQ